MVTWLHIMGERKCRAYQGVSQFKVLWLCIWRIYVYILGWPKGAIKFFSITYYLTKQMNLLTNLYKYI